MRDGEVSNSRALARRHEKALARGKCLAKKKKKKKKQRREAAAAARLQLYAGCSKLVAV